MPATFPSHQGLIAFLWRRWPGRFDVRALCVGAAMPDVVDALLVVVRGRMGQGIGHSILGLLALGIPLGLLLWIGLHRAVRGFAPRSGDGVADRLWNACLAVLRQGAGAAGLRREWRRILGGLLLGGMSHLLFDLVSHGGFPWLLPWVPKLKIYPDWWYDVWFSIPRPWSRSGKIIGPPRAIWIAMTLWGAWVLVRPHVRRTTAARSPSSSERRT